MTQQVAFFYATGTSYLINSLELGFSIDISGTVRWFGDKILIPGKSTPTQVSGLNGKTYTWAGLPHEDPFPFMLNPDVWDATRIKYPDSTLGMAQSIDYGINQTVKLIKALPPGQPFAIGGYSQGAAVMSGVYNEIRTGSLISRAPSFLGGVMFGNPRRQVNFRGPIGGTWSGAWDVPGSTTGGHGSFPATGNWARLTGCDANKWVEFTNPGDMFNCTGDSTNGLNWTKGNDLFLNLLNSEYAGAFLTGSLPNVIFTSAANAVLNALGITNNLKIPNAILDGIMAATSFGYPNYVIDALSNAALVGGGGHTQYPYLPPPNSSTGVVPTTVEFTKNGNQYLKPVGDTCYQLALKWLEGLAEQYAVSSIALATDSPGWSTTLVPPGDSSVTGKPKFYWSNGTTWLAEFLGNSIPMPGSNAVPWNIKGLNGATVSTTGGEANDPFPAMLDTAVWNVQKVPYPATLTNGWASINAGVDYIVNDVLKSPFGTKFAVGGYSQGGAVTHRVIMETRSGGRLSARANDLVAAVTFGSPMRESNHTYPGSSGYSGAIDVSGSTTGGHGVFPANKRITSTPSLCWDFTMPLEVSSGVGDSTIGQAISTATGLSLVAPTWVGQLVALAAAAAVTFLTNTLTAAGASHVITDALTGATRSIAGGGHPLYPHLPPPAANGTIPTSGLTCYQIAAQYLMDVGSRTT